MSAASAPSTRRRDSFIAASVRQFRSNLKMKKNSATFRKIRTSVTLVRMKSGKRLSGELHARLIP
jgi:hypothetical protein